MRRKISLVILGLLGGLGLCQAVLYAANITITFTNGQNTYAQTTLIPQANARRCAEWNLAPSCNTSQVVAAGCVAAPFSAVTKTNLVFRSCTIYTLDAAGETAYDSDRLYEVLLAQVANDLESDIIASCTAYKAQTVTVQNNICSEIGRPSGCRLCR